MSKRLIIFSVTFVLCFLLNFIKHNSFLTSILNSSILLLSILFFENYTSQKPNIPPIFIVLLAAIPLFSFNPQLIQIHLLFLLTLLILFLSTKTNKFKIILLIFGIILLSGGLLLTGKIAYLNGSIDYERLVFTNPHISEFVIQYQKDALYLPYKLRTLVYNNSITLYSIIGNIFKLISLKSLYDILLIANMYPLIYGLYLSFKSNNVKKYLFIYIGLFVTLLIIGINRSPDKFNSLYFASPFILFFVLLGLQKINIKIYSFLLLISLFLL